MAILKLQDAVDARVAIDIDPCEDAINEHLRTQRVVDYVTNPEITNPNIQVNLDGVQLTKAAQEALKASIEAAEWKSVAVKQNAKGVVVTFSKEEKQEPEVPGAYAVTFAADPIVLKAGDTGATGATITKGGQPHTGTPEYSSNKNSVVTVAADGTLTAVAAGSAVITVKEGELYSGTVNVTVTAA